VVSGGAGGPGLAMTVALTNSNVGARPGGHHRRQSAGLRPGRQQSPGDRRLTAAAVSQRRTALHGERHSLSPALRQHLAARDVMTPALGS